MSASHNGTPRAVGRPLDRVDGPLKVTGGARYAADAPVADPLHAALVQSTAARGRIQSIDESAARATPGVLEVITHRNAPRVERVAFDPRGVPNVEAELPPLQSGEIRYWGQHVAVVVARTAEAARAGADRLAISYDAQPAVVTLGSGGENAPLAPGFFGMDLQHVRGDAQRSIERAASRIDAVYRTPVQHHHPIEPSATVAEWRGDDLIVHDATQWVAGTQRTLAKLFGIDDERVLVISPYLGGGFGCKGWFWPHTAIAAMTAKAVGRPVKLVLTREQMFTSCGHRSETEQWVRLGASPDGDLVATLHDVLTTSSHVGDFVEAAGMVSTFLYRCPDVAVSHRTVRLDIGTPTAMRAPGETPGTFALECAMDELAYALAADPLELRIRNHADRDGSTGQEYSSKALLDAYRSGAERFGWERRSHAPRSMREGGELIGWGVATATYPALRSAARARVGVDLTGRATVASATHDLGTGMYTILTQVASDALGIAPEEIVVRIGDSSLPRAPIAGGSQSTASVAPAVLEAASALRREAIDIAVASGASPLFGCVPDDVEARDGMLRSRTDAARAISYADVVRLSGSGALEVVREAAPGDEDGRYALQSFGAQFCEVRCDEEIARLRVTRFVAVIDAGRVLNPKTARSQIIGGVTMGIGMALFEETVRDERYGSVITNDLADYRLPVNADIPDIEVIFVEKPDLRFNPLGVRGIGEIGITGVAAAVANAVHHATGVRVRDLPIVPEKLLGVVEPGLKRWRTPA